MPLGERCNVRLILGCVLPEATIDVTRHTIRGDILTRRKNEYCGAFGVRRPETAR
jgi:hypothetical protein